MDTTTDHFTPLALRMRGNQSATILSDYAIDDEEMQEFPVFVGSQKLTSAMKLRPEKWW